jgi:hypothetical protein
MVHVCTTASQSCAVADLSAACVIGVSGRGLGCLQCCKHALCKMVCEVQGLGVKGNLDM